MKKIYCFLAAACLIVGASAANADVIFSDDFSAPPNTVGQPDSNWTIKTGWNTASDWQVTANGTYNCLDSKGDGSTARGFTTANIAAPKDFVVEYDAYNIAAEAGVILRGVNNGTFMDHMYFTVNPWAYGDGRMYFINFDLGLGQLTIINQVSMNYNGPLGGYVSSDKIHVKVVAQGDTYTAFMDAYAADGALKASQTVSAIDTIAGRAGREIGLATYGTTEYDNFTVSTVPEPGSMMALMSGLGLAAAAFRKRRA